MIRRALVEKEKWITPQKFNRVLAVYQALPGPEAHEMCVYMGMVKAGRIGAVLAGLGFMLPGVLLMILLAALYTKIGPAVMMPYLTGAKPAVAALVLVALFRIGRHAITSTALGVAVAASLVMTLLGAHFIPVLLVCGILTALWQRAPVFALALVAAAVAGALLQHGVSAAAPSLHAPQPLFLEGLKAGLLSFGGAYTAIPFLHDAMVNVHPNIDESTFIDAIAFTTLVPAPLISFSTFLGYMASGASGALAITLGVFLPAFLFTLIGHRYLEKIVEHKPLHAFLDGITAGVVGMLAPVAFGLLRTAVVNDITALFFAASLVCFVLVQRRWAVPAIIVAACIAGALTAM